MTPGDARVLGALAALADGAELVRSPGGLAWHAHFPGRPGPSSFAGGFTLADLVGFLSRRARV